VFYGKLTGKSISREIKDTAVSISSIVKKFKHLPAKSQGFFQTTITEDRVLNAELGMRKEKKRTDVRNQKTRVKEKNNHGKTRKM
jgi:hypothetical protein